ncbi:pyridoxal phosphate-dependent transferase [Chytridium lagenaria]|nr:pyridoxal phosphate-dependent transferase [Chytridium lagenaria]
MPPVSTFGAVPALPLDPIFALAAECKADPDPNKINLSIGAYRDNDGKPWVLPVVKKAEKLIVNDPSLDHEYLPIDGLRSFTDASARVILGADSENTLALISDPTWGNHFAIFGDAGFQVRKYKYWDAEGRKLAFDEFFGDFEVDPTTRPMAVKSQTWCRAKSHFPFFDCAYQGFASGSLDADAFAVRLFSYSKNFGLYGETDGVFDDCAWEGGEDAAVRSQLCRLNRASISNPPSFWGEGYWSHIITQIGMFSYTGLTVTQCVELKKRFHVYLSENGRISMAGLNEGNGLDWVVRNVK